MRKAKMRKGTFILLQIVCVFVTSGLFADVKVWEIPQGQKIVIEKRDGWKEATVSSSFAGGAVVENEGLIVMVSSDSTPVICTRDGNISAGVKFFSNTGVAGTVTQIKLGSESNAMQAVLQLKVGLSELALTVHVGGMYVGFIPVTNIIALEVKKTGTLCRRA